MKNIISHNIKYKITNIDYDYWHVKCEYYIINLVLNRIFHFKYNI